MGQCVIDAVPLPPSLAVSVPLPPSIAVSAPLPLPSFPSPPTSSPPLPCGRCHQTSPPPPRVPNASRAAPPHRPQIKSTRQTLERGGGRGAVPARPGHGPHTHKQPKWHTKKTHTHLFTGVGGADKREAKERGVGRSVGGGGKTPLLPPPPPPYEIIRVTVGKGATRPPLTKAAPSYGLQTCQGRRWQRGQGKGGGGGGDQVERRVGMAGRW